MSAFKELTYPAASARAPTAAQLDLKLLNRLMKSRNSTKQLMQPPIPPKPQVALNLPVQFASNFWSCLFFPPHLLCLLIPPLPPFPPRLPQSQYVKSAVHMSCNDDDPRNIIRCLCQWHRIIQSPLLAPRRCGEFDVIKTSVFESRHPYADNSDYTHKISCSGAVRMEVSFDPRSATVSICL